MAVTGRRRARVDEVAQIQDGGDIGVLDEVNAVAAGGDAVGGAAQLVRVALAWRRREKMTACW